MLREHVYKISCTERLICFHYIKNYLPKSMQQNTSSEANSRSFSQKNLRLLLNLKVHDHVHKSPQLVPVYNQIIYVKFEFFTAVRMMMIFFWVLVPCLFVGRF
jgi:hypothetical protein